MTFAYADPPYIGQAKKHYSDDPRCAEVNHRVLIGTLCSQYDAWALSMSATMYSLKEIVPLAPEEARMAAWTKPFASFKPGVNPAYTWEPVLFYSPRKRTRTEPTVKDHVAESITMQRGLAGAKPEAFSLWLFDLVGLEPADDFTDVFPGSGAVQDVYERWRRRELEQPEPDTLFSAAA